MTFCTFIINGKDTLTFSSTSVKTIKDITIADLEPDDHFREKPVARGVAGRPMSQTPALEGARRAHVDCEINVDSLAYWNYPQGKRDEEFRSPFAIEVRIVSTKQ